MPLVPVPAPPRKLVREPLRGVVAAASVAGPAQHLLVVPQQQPLTNVRPGVP